MVNRWLPLMVLCLPLTAQASDFTMVMFLFSMPVCLVLVIVAFVLATTLGPRWGWLLWVPVGLLVGVNLYMLPEMRHFDERVAIAVQGALSALSLFAFRVFRGAQAGSPPE